MDYNKLNKILNGIEPYSKVTDFSDYSIIEPLPRIICKDGFSMSVQAGVVYYSYPKSNYGPYSHLEVGYPSHPEELLYKYKSGNFNQLDPVYCYVPKSIIMEIIKKHKSLFGFMKVDKVIEITPEFNLNFNSGLLGI